mmetsp:Transcript_95749/g.166349  ORF Transcript_95749/g.166349 Transcript_95749/m.166349 type:complete len:84 (+) Transcript_95749:1057-1308(+)
MDLAQWLVLTLNLNLTISVIQDQQKKQSRAKECDAAKSSVMGHPLIVRTFCDITQSARETCAIDDGNDVDIDPVGERVSLVCQ